MLVLLFVALTDVSELDKIRSYLSNPDSAKHFKKTIHRVGTILLRETRRNDADNFKDKPTFERDRILSLELSILNCVIPSGTSSVIGVELEKSSAIYFREVMRAIGVENIDTIMANIDPLTTEDLVTRELLSREGTVRMDDGTILYANRARYETVSEIQHSVDIVSGSSDLSCVVEGCLALEGSYFRYIKKCRMEFDYTPGEICADMEALRAQRATVLAEAKEYQPSVDHWSTSTELNSSLRRMQIVDEPLKDYFAKYFDTLGSEAINKSPYKRPMLSKRSLARMIPDTQ